MDLFKKTPGVYCEDCKHYIPSDSNSKIAYFSTCARLTQTLNLSAPRVVRVQEEIEVAQSCVDARKDGGDCGKQGEFWEERLK